MDRFLSRVYDDSFLGIDSLKYLPWVGKYYTTIPKEKRILIIAESVYDWGEDEAELMLSKNDFVREIVHGHGLFHTTDWGGVQNSRLVRGIERSIFDKSEVSNSERENLWPYISFHEFVQRPMSNLEEKPKTKDFDLGSKILKDIINILKPRTCIFFGTAYPKIRTLEIEYASAAEWPSDKKINGSIPNIIDINRADNLCRFIFVKHPSRHFSWDLWNEFIVKNLPSPFYWERNK